LKAPVFLGLEEKPVGMQPRARWSGILVADIVQERLKATEGFLIDVFLFWVMCEEVWMHPQEKFAECLLQERMRSAVSISLMPPPGGQPCTLSPAALPSSGNGLRGHY